MEPLEFRYDTQLLIEGKNLDEDAIHDYFMANFKGDCLIAVGDPELIKIHFHTNEPWQCGCNNFVVKIYTNFVWCKILACTTFNINFHIISLLNMNYIIYK